MLTFSMQPIGFVRSPRMEPIDDDWGAVVARVTLHEERFTADSLGELEQFSHIDVVYVFDRVDESSIELGARRPPNNPDWPAVGVFAQRNKCRPNRIGVGTCELCEVDGIELTVRGLDAIDGTPVLDIKPYMVEFGPRGVVRQPCWSHELMSRYWEALPKRVRRARRRDP
jgi:tRNA (adenine37-N6)-methyltransferase